MHKRLPGAGMRWHFHKLCWEPGQDKRLLVLFCVQGNLALTWTHDLH
jgi:hypothetical protein